MRVTLDDLTDQERQKLIAQLQKPCRQGHVRRDAYVVRQVHSPGSFMVLCRLCHNARQRKRRRERMGRNE